MQERETLRPEQLTERVRRLLEEHFGVAPTTVGSAFTRGNAGLLAEHTAYFEGFAFMLPLELGTAVAVRENQEAESRIVFEGVSHPWTFDRTQPLESGGHEPEWIRVLQSAAARFAGEKGQVDMAVITTIPWCLTETYLSALASAANRALGIIYDRPDANQPAPVASTEAVIQALGMPFSIAYPLAAEETVPRGFVLVDAGTHEHLPVEAPSREVLGWGLVDLGTRLSQKASQVEQRKQRAAEAVAILREHGFPSLNSLRDLDHQDLQRAMNQLPRAFRGAFRFLVMENRRVQKMIFAARRNDWQMFGALLFMSHASRRNDWVGSTEKADFVVEQVESMSLEGMYGASLVSTGGAVLVVGQPFVVPQCLDRIARAFEAQYGSVPETYLL